MSGLKMLKKIIQIYSYSLTTSKKTMVNNSFDNYRKTTAQPYIHWYIINNKTLLNWSLKIDMTKWYQAINISLTKINISKIGG